MIWAIIPIFVKVGHFEGKGRNNLKTVKNVGHSYIKHSNIVGTGDMLNYLKFI